MLLGIKVHYIGLSFIILIIIYSYIQNIKIELMII